jgi:hypothetical protein
VLRDKSIRDDPGNTGRLFDRLHEAFKYDWVLRLLPALVALLGVFLDWRAYARPGETLQQWSQPER